MNPPKKKQTTVFERTLARTKRAGHCVTALDEAIAEIIGGPGFEPGLTESESVVLPLDDPPSADC